MTALGRPRYPGATPFGDSETDRALFVGRRRESDALTNAILSSDLTVVYGLSGSGKTSLLKAGVFEPLRRADMWPVVVRLEVPKENAAELVRDSILEAAHAEDIELIPADPPADDLWALLSGLEVWRGDTLLTPILVFDQFEELFTLDWDPEARASFISQFGWVTRRHRPREKGRPNTPAPDAKFVILIREDSLGELEALADEVPHIMRMRFRLNRLDREQAEDAIREPARVARRTVAGDSLDIDSEPFEYTDGAVDQLIGFLAREWQRGKQVPSARVEAAQLQIICKYIEEEFVGVGNRGVEVTESDLGGERGLNRMLRDFYTRQLETIPDDQANAVHRMCESFLITDTGRRISRQVDEIVSKYRVPKETLDQLVTQRLLRSERRTGSTYYELAHDSLVKPILEYADEQRREQQQRRTKILVGVSALILIPLVAGFIFWLANRPDQIVTQPTVTGTVTGHDGGGLEGATVEFHAPPADGVEPNLAAPAATATTIEDGTFTAGLPPGDYRVRFLAPLHAEQWYEGASALDESMVLTVSDDTNVELAPQLTPLDGTIEFVVHAGPSTDVRLTRITDSGPVEEMRSNFEGPGEFVVPTPGTYVLSFESGDFLPTTVDVALGVGQSANLLDIFLVGEQVEDQVTFVKRINGADRAEVFPGETLTVEYIVSNNSDTDVVVDLIVDTDLGVELTGFEEVESGSTVSVMEEVAARGVGESDPPIICADGPGLATTATMMFRRGGERDEATAIASYCLRQLATVAGRVFTDADGDGAFDDGETGVPGAVVTISSESGFMDTVTTSLDGNYAFQVAAGTYAVTVQPAAGAVANAPTREIGEIDEGRTVSVDFSIVAAPSTITGVVYEVDGPTDPDRSPLPGVVVVVVDAQTSQVVQVGQANDAGEFSFEVVDGLYELFAEREDGTDLFPSTRVSVAGADVVVELVVDPS